MTPFVGAARQNLVSELEAVYAEVAAGGGPRLVLLSAPIGYGKSRIVQEFYARLASRQPAPPYWPPRLDDLATGVRWTECRKRVSPGVFSVLPGATMPWFWWGVSCGKRQDGRHYQALFDDSTQLAAHAEALYERLRRSEALGRSFDGTSALIGALGLLGVALVPPVAIGTTVAGGMRTLWQNRDLVERLSGWRERREQKATGGLIDPEGHGRAQQIAELAANAVTVSTAVPVVVVVDDLHWADGTLVTFLDSLLRAPRGRVMCIGTAWPSGAGDELGELWSWFDRAEDVPDLRARISVQTLDPLGKNELAELVRAEYSLAAPADADPLPDVIVSEIVKLVGVTPLGVCALFGLERTRRMILDGGLSAERVGRLPRDLEDALRQYWDEMPGAVQKVLSIGAVCGSTFAALPVVSAAADVGVVQPEDKLREGESLFRFVSTVDLGVARFVDPAFHATAANEAEDSLTSEEWDATRRRTVEYALESREAAAASEAAWSAHVRWATDGFVDRKSALASAARLARMHATRYDYSSAIDLARRGLEWQPDAEDALAVSLRADLVQWLRLVGRLAEGVETARQLIALLERHPQTGARDEQLVVVRLELIFLLKQQKALDAALGECDRADECVSRMPEGEPARQFRRKVLRARGHCLGETAATVPKAIDVLQALLSELGPEAWEEAMYLRHDLGSLHGDQRIPSRARLRRSVSIFRELYADRRRLLGDHHPATLETAHALAWVMLDSDIRSGSEALSLFRLVATQRERILGRGNPETLRTRCCVASILAERGDRQTAMREFEAVLDDSLQFLGAEHPDTKYLKTLAEEAGAPSWAIAARWFLRANDLKPREGESFDELRSRAASTAPMAPRGGLAARLLCDSDPERAQRYQRLDWSTRIVSLAAVRVWPRMGGLPDEWCNGSVKDLAERVRAEGIPTTAGRLGELERLRQATEQDAFESWIRHVPLLVVPDNTLHPRPQLEDLPWALDDGGHRAVMMAVIGLEEATALVGVLAAGMASIPA